MPEGVTSLFTLVTSSNHKIYEEESQLELEVKIKSV